MNYGVKMTIVNIILTKLNKYKGNLLNIRFFK